MDKSRSVFSLPTGWALLFHLAMSREVAHSALGQLPDPWEMLTYFLLKHLPISSLWNAFLVTPKPCGSYDQPRRAASAGSVVIFLLVRLDKSHHSLVSAVPWDRAISKGFFLPCGPVGLCPLQKDTDSSNERGNCRYRNESIPSWAVR